MLAIKSSACNSGVNRKHGIEWSHRPIRSERERRARIQQRAKRVSCLRAFWSDALFGPASIVNRVIWLHRGNDFIAGETCYVLRSQMLCMLDTKAPIAIAVFLLYALVNRKNVVIRT